MITREQLKTELDSLEDMQALHQIYQLIQQLKLSFAMTETMTQPTLSEQHAAMDHFFGMHQELGTDSVEEELRTVRQGRRGDFNLYLSMV